MLEVIDKGAVTVSHPSPLLFVHGGYHAAWCWDEHFLDFFADQGFRAAALSVRAHGGSGSDKPRKKCTVADYVDDVRAVADGLGGAPIVVGHSLGGFVVQHYLSRYDAPAAVLMASVPPRGVLRCALRTALHHPWLATSAMKAANQGVFTRRTREALFCAFTPQAIVDATTARCEPESIRAAMYGAGFQLPDVARISAPLLVLGGADDGLFTNAEVRRTATTYGTVAELFPRMGHNMMLEPGWRDVAERIAAWLMTHNL